MVLDGPSLLGLLSAAGLLALAAPLLRLGPRRGPAFLLGLLALCWGLQVLTVRLAFVLGPPPARPFLLASNAFAVPLYLFLLHFAATYPRPLRATASRGWVPALLLPAAAMVGLIAIDAASAVDAAGGAGRSTWGWATILVLFVPFHGAQVFALLRSAWAAGPAPGGPVAAQLRLAALAWLVYLSYASVHFLAASPALAFSLGPSGLAVFQGALVLGLAAVGAAAGRLARGAAGTRGRLGWLAAAAVPAVMGLALGRDDVLGLWRLAAVAVLAYAVARYQLFDLEVRLRSAVRPVAAAVLGLAAWGVAASVTGAVWPLQPGGFLAAGVVGAAVGLALAWPAGWALDRAFPYLRATEEYLRRRRLEVYHAAVEAGVGPGALDALARELRLQRWERRPLERAADPAPPALPGTLAGRYRVERYLGPGVLGRVFLAWDQRVGEAVVLKEYAGFGGAAAAEGFVREARALGALDHRHVLAVRDVFRAGEDLYIALEHAPGGSLAGRLTAAPVREAEAVAVVRPLLEGLAAAHRRGIVHRDVHPGNVLFRGATLKVADFGVAFDPVLDGAVRAARAQPGTVAWMAPEQARGDPATPATDVHAAGAVLYRLLAGKPWVAVDGVGEAGARRRIATRAPRLPLPGVSAATNAVLSRALAKDPRARYPDAAAMLRDLRPRGALASLARSP